MNLKLVKVTIILLIFCVIYNIHCAKILGIFPSPISSHYILGNSLMNALAEKGHNVTMISPFENKNPPKNGTFHDVILSGFVEWQTRHKEQNNFFKRDMVNPIFALNELNSRILKLTEVTLNHTNVQKLLNSTEFFDVIVIEQFTNDALKGFAAHFKAPFIAFSMLPACNWVNELVSNPSPLSYIPDLFLTYSSNMSFFQRVMNGLMYLYIKASNTFYVYPNQAKLIQKYFSNAPNFFDLYYNASLVLLPSHPSINQPVPLVPNMIEIGGLHIKSPKTLPKDLQEFLDSADDGVIYFSMGSNLRSMQLSIEKRDALLRAFSKIKQKVLWKWENEELPGKPDNVKIAKWLPQQDVLAHPNIKLFITHGGLLSIMESIYHGVPMLIIPIYGDQKTNAARATNDGYALVLYFSDITETRLSQKIDELLYNQKYREITKSRSKIFHDQQVKPLDRAIYWVEYIIRHKGANHLKVAGLKLSWYKYYLLDLITLLILIFIIVYILLFLIIKKLYQDPKIKLKQN